MRETSGSPVGAVGDCQFEAVREKDRRCVNYPTLSQVRRKTRNDRLTPTAIIILIPTLTLTIHVPVRDC